LPVPALPIERAVLLLVARPNAPDAVPQLAQRHQLLASRVVPAERAVRRVVPIAQEDVLIGLEGGVRQRDRVLRVERVDVGAAGDVLGHSRVELVDVDPLPLEVHRGEAQRVGADPEIDVLGDEDRRLALVVVADVERHHQDQVVGGLTLAERGRHGPGRRGDPQPAARGQGRPVREARAFCTQPVQHARHLPGVAPALRGLLLELIDLLDDEDRDDDLVVGEREDGARIVNQNVRVENEVFHSPTSLPSCLSRW
jgi:hypothetical protein